jgi:hypothetical protein
MDIGASMLKLSIPVCVLLATYLVGLVVYRLYWSPISKFPGPRLAAVSNWYEFYYDVILQGKFTFHIQDLHKQYGLTTYSSKRMPN